MDRLMIRHGLVLILLALLGGFVAPSMVNPRLGAGAHLIGIVSGLVLMAIGAAKPVFVLERRPWLALHACWFVAAYANWANSMLAGLTGASRLTPIAGAGTIGSPLAEAIVAALFVVVGVSSLVGTAIGVYGLLGADRRGT